MPPRLHRYSKRDPTPPQLAILCTTKIDERPVWLDADGRFGCYDERNGAGWIWRKSLTALKKEVVRRSPAVEVMCIPELSTPPPKMRWYDGWSEEPQRYTSRYQRVKVALHERSGWRLADGTIARDLGLAVAVDEPLEAELIALQEEYTALLERWASLIETRARELTYATDTGALKFREPQSKG